jgi:hypothetical protein
MKPFSPTIGLAAVVFALLQLPSVSAAGSSVTLFLDGAIVEQAESARKGYVELLLPPSARPDSLKIKPKPGTTINRVVVKPRKPTKGRDHDIAMIEERQDQLHDRIKALSVREEIFKSAAKSQSGKAPRKTKTNPEPLAGIRQGTDYAIAQLEAVYTAKRKAEKELKLLDEKRVLLAKDVQSAGNIAKIWVSPPSGTVTASWSQTDRNWSPSYELRADSPDKFRISLFTGEVPKARGEKVTFDLSSLDVPAAAPRYRIREDNSSIKLDNLKISRKPEDLSSFPMLVIAADAKGNLPSGDISCYRDGEYLGTGKFPGVEAGRTVEFRCINR